MTTMPDSEAIQEGTYAAFLRVLDATGGYPFTRDDIITAIRDGVHQAVAEYLDAHGLGVAGGSDGA